MNDCSNAEIRDRLPDLLHERLDMSVRAVVMAHVADCVDCREELQLLRGVHTMLVGRTPLVDVTRVVGALPKPPARVVSPALPMRATRPMRRLDWRIAAAVTFLAVGGSSVALLNRAPQAMPSDSMSIQASAVVPPTQPPVPAKTEAAIQSPARSATTANTAPAATEHVAAVDEQAAVDVSPSGRLADLNESQLKALLGEIDRLEPVPVTEPEPVSIRVNARRPSSPEGA